MGAESQISLDAYHAFKKKKVRLCLLEFEGSHISLFGSMFCKIIFAGFESKFGFTFSCFSFFNRTDIHNQHVECRISLLCCPPIMCIYIVSNPLPSWGLGNFHKGFKGGSWEIFKNDMGVAYRDGG